MGRVLRRTALLTVAAAGLFALWRGMQRHHQQSDVSWEAGPFPFPPVPRPSVPGPSVPAAGPPTPAPERTWVDPGGDSCPESHPVKAKLGSGIFHVPGGRSYDRTKPDRCYCDATAAAADGLRPSKV